MSARPGQRTRGWLSVGSLHIPVALGRTGIKANKREGDGATPRGVFRPVQLWVRGDRGPIVARHLRQRKIGPDDAWCEDPKDRRYNRPVKLRPAGPGDRLWREDRLYDIIVEIDHNASPRVAGRGSAVFIHVARPGLAPTAGCVALPPHRLRWLVGWIGPRTKIIVQ